ncbi:hypothetical protein [Streptomyces sp. NPDC048442]|uniref:hypothetical protein n=1 Tax=Streptomyces sp. NPDC048442 TaxID=3154823 RepID=UPI003431C313
MGTLPGRFMRHQVTVEPLLGQGPYGPQYGPPVVTRCFLDEQTRMVRSPGGDQVTSSSTAYAPLTTVAPPGSRVMLPDGRKTAVIAALRRDGGGLPTPDHLEVQLE